MTNFNKELTNLINNYLDENLNKCFSKKEKKMFNRIVAVHSITLNEKGKKLDALLKNQYSYCFKAID